MGRLRRIANATGELRTSMDDELYNERRYDTSKDIARVYYGPRTLLAPDE